MALLRIDPALCDRCGICARTCPMGLIRMEEAGPQPIDDARSLCIDCGHCVAVCPRAALSHETIGLQDCRPYSRQQLPSVEQASLLLRSRRSIRVYDGRPLSRASLEALLADAAYAPSGHNYQQVRWTLIYDTDRLRTLSAMVIDWMRALQVKQPELAAAMRLDWVIGRWEAGEDTICRDAPHLLLAHAGEKDRLAASACTIALSYVELAAHARGLGACWAGYFNAAAIAWPELRQALDLPEGHSPLGSLILGHPRYTYDRIPPRKTPQVRWL